MEAANPVSTLKKTFTSMLRKIQLDKNYSATERCDESSKKTQHLGQLGEVDIEKSGNFKAFDNLVSLDFRSFSEQDIYVFFFRRRKRLHNL